MELGVDGSFHLGNRGERPRNSRGSSSLRTQLSRLRLGSSLRTSVLRRSLLEPVAVKGIVEEVAFVEENTVREDDDSEDDGQEHPHVPVGVQRDEGAQEDEKENSDKEAPAKRRVVHFCDKLDRRKGTEGKRGRKQEAR